jgi:uncharacterized membrane protein YphA (DoxX/SURF4 family)
MNWLSKTFLVLLRLAIGWHFLVEGYEKIHSHYIGPTETNRPWTSEFYLREATGPLGDSMRSLIGDPDEAALERLTPLPLQPGQDPLTTPAKQRFPPALGREWDDYGERFIAFYRIAPLGAPMVQEKLDQSKDRTARWLLHGTKTVKKTFPSGTTSREETTQERVQEYRAKLLALREMQKRKLPLFGHDVEKEKLRAAKAEVNRLRADLLGDLNQETAAMRKALESNPYMGKAPTVVMPEPEPVRPIERIDAIIRYALVAIGAGLLLGLFTRLACLGGAAFLLTLYLLMPPFPWLPENLRAEGHYLFIDKNLIEMLALLALATLPSGRWAGLDGLLSYLVHSLRPRRASPTHEDVVHDQLVQAVSHGTSPRRTPPPTPDQPASPGAASAPASVLPPTQTEPSHGH